MGAHGRERAVHTPFQINCGWAGFLQHAPGCFHARVERFISGCMFSLQQGERRQIHPIASHRADQSGAAGMHLLDRDRRFFRGSQVFDHQMKWQMPLVNNLHSRRIIRLEP